MKCERFDEIVILYLEKKLSDEEIKDVKKHLKDCDRCREYLLFLKEILMNKRFKENENYWQKLKKKIMEKINNYIGEIKKIRIKKGVIGILLGFFFIFSFLIKIEIEKHIAKYYHLYKNYEIIENLDQLKEIAEYENEGNIENE